MELIKKAVLAQRAAVVKTLQARAEVLEKEIKAGGKKEDAAKVAERGVTAAAIAAFNKKTPEFTIGDTVKVSVRIVEGEKERIQVFTGVVIARRGPGMAEMFTVRRIVNNEGVERVFPVYSPKVAGIEVIRGGQVRRAKLYFLRDRVGKKTRLKDLKVAVPGAAEPAATAEQTTPPASAPAAAQK
jgi:large subunit ribosomal protein L19